MIRFQHFDDVDEFTELSVSSLQDGRGFNIGQLVWGKVKGFSWWPGLVVAWKTKTSPKFMRRVEWFGDGMYSEVRISPCILMKVSLDFTQHFNLVSILTQILNKS